MSKNEEHVVQIGLGSLPGHPYLFFPVCHLPESLSPEVEVEGHRDVDLLGLLFKYKDQTQHEEGVIIEKSGLTP